jgi:hypothetical protein
LDLGSPSKWLTDYMHIYEANVQKMQNGEKARLMVYHYGDGSGWGNRLRASFFAFIYATLTGRMLLIDHDDMFYHFNQPTPAVLTVDSERRENVFLDYLPFDTTLKLSTSSNISLLVMVLFCIVAGKKITDQLAVTHCSR